MIKYLFVLITFLAPLTLFSTEPVVVDKKEAELARLINQAPKLHYPKLLDYNLKKLEVVYSEALKNADPEYREALKQSQKAWLEFFKADGVVASWNAKGGSDAYNAQVSQKIFQIRLRIYQLATPYLQGWAIDVPSVPFPTTDQGTQPDASKKDSMPK